MGHKIRFLARIERWDGNMYVTTYQWGKAAVEVNDNTSVRPFLNRDPSQNQISIYPNPVKDGRFTIQMRSEQPESELAVTIFDLQGRSIYSTQIYPAPGNNRFVVSPGGLLTPGLYVVSIEGKQCLSRAKLIVR
ncbi:MAG: T9SS type A sorting domain-containing protein [Desulfobacteraceae bacterium]|nr:T9SS type A sorting domain-containing protein [Desulfobacteraceae bacterium]